MTDAALHATHPEIVNRLKRAGGHLQSIITMIEDGRPCRDVAQQMYAVEKAVAQAKRVLIQDHLDHCLDAVISKTESSQRDEIEDFKAIAKFL